MEDAIVAAVRAHAAREAPRECCGVVTVERGRRRYRPCRNIAEHVDRDGGQFAIHPADWAAAEDAGELVAVCHSHVFISPEPSQADRVECERSGLPWLIVNHPLGHWAELNPSGYQAPLVGRTFSWGVLDCYALVRDHYATLGIALADGARPPRDWAGAGEFYRERLEERGFVRVTSAPLAHDVLLIRVGAPVPNHSAVLLEGNVLLHHLEGRLSSRDVFGGFWRLNTAHVMRHRDLA